MSLENRYDIDIDLKLRTIIDVKYKQGDIDSSVLGIHIKDNGVAVDITGETIEFRFFKPDKTVVYQDSTQGVTIIDGTNGEVDCVLKSNTLAAPGTVKCEIHRKKDGKELTTPSFYFTVESSIGENGILSTNYISLIEDKITGWQNQFDLMKSAYDAATKENTVVELTGARHDNVNNKDYANIGARMDSYATSLNDMTSGGLDRVKASSKFLTTMTSWLGILNTKYTDDNATRFYILPKAKVTTGVGGCLKIFADDYQNGADYRDLGIYFSADQNGDTGYYGSGVDWINVKVLDNGAYAGKHPDLGFSFQDGHVVAGRITCFNNTRPVWVFGSSKPSILNTSLIAEFQGNVGVTKGNGLKLMTADDTKAHTASDDTDDTLKWSILNGEKKYINGAQTENKTVNVSEFKNAVVTSSRKNVLVDGSTFDVTGVNRVVINQPSTNNQITSITGGVDGQEIVIINVAPNSNPQNTTIVHGTNIKLQGGNPFVMSYNSTLTLICIGSTWYEKCRSVNA